MRLFYIFLLSVFIVGCGDEGYLAEGTYAKCVWKGEMYEGYVIENADNIMVLESFGMKTRIPIRELRGLKVWKPSDPDYEEEMRTKPPRK